MYCIIVLLLIAFLWLSTEQGTNSSQSGLILCCSPYQRIRWRWWNAFGDDASFIHVHLIFKLLNYQTPRLAAYADDSGDVQSMNSTEILARFAIVYDTDSILVVVDGVGREFVAERSCMFCFKFVVRLNFFTYTISSNTWSVNSVSQSWI